jgi:ribonuclease G
MSKEIYISSTPHETRLAIVENEALTEIYYERENEYTLAGSIYNGRVTRVLPGMQSSFVDIGLERDAFLYITDFMEEAPDSAEFDTTSHGDHGSRTPKLSPSPRTEEAGAPRSDSGGRGGGRGRRSGRDRDRNGADRAGADQMQGSRPAGIEEIPITPSETELEDRPIEIGRPDAQVSGVGEGAPGADGSRRWRGRRGRRRGRGGPGGLRDEAGPIDATAPSEAEGDSELEIEGAATAEAPADRDVSTPQPFRGQDRAGRATGGRDESRKDRPRENDGWEGNRGGRDGLRHDQRPQRVPRGFAPSRDLYGVDTGETAGPSSATGPVANAYGDATSAVEPIVLPGESLSKYRKGSEFAQPAKAVEATPVQLAPPANLFTVAAGWDGGAVLPGETLSRRRPVENEGRSEQRREAGRPSGRNSRPERDGRGFGEQFPAAPVPLVALEPAPRQAEESKVEPSEATPVPAGDYEPIEASVSYRVDPLPRSEFRQSAPVLEPAVEVEEAEGEEPENPSAAVSVAIRQDEGLPAALEPEEIPGRDEVLANLHSQAEAQAAVEAPVAIPEIAPHEITSISDAGEMISEPAEPPIAAEPAPIEVPDPASPIRHEGAVLGPAEGLRTNSFTEEPSRVSAAHETVHEMEGRFAPGAGELAEELLDDDEYDGALHASSIEEIDDLDEEETLEGAADLGTMLREMSIDQITRTSPEVEEEEDFEEDDLEEDDLEEEDDEEEGPGEFVTEGGADLGDFNEESQEEAARAGSPEDAEFFEKQFAQGSEGIAVEGGNGGAASAGETERRGGTRDGRRDGRRGRNDRDRKDRDRGDRPRNTGGSGDRDRGRSGSHGNGHSGGRGRTMQATNLPAISDLLKPGQEILVQIAKEPIAKKGARITSHIALPGRFLVFMPTVSHTGVSRKIESDAERRRLKEILLSEKGDASGGFIVRTAAEGASEEELRSDLRFLLNLWSDIKARSESSKSPALIYHDLNLIERILRDQVTDNFSAIWVDTENEYERVLRFLQRFQPSLIRRVKLYSKETPLFEQFGITEEINKALRSKVWLKSGGSIVINQTEALVAIDINTGKFVGKTARLEDTIVKTNLDAIPEIVRQIRLRDLGGIIIIDFIDMDERKNRNRVMAALEEELKSDRAPSKVLQFNDFGLVAITRKRVKQSLERTLSTTCNICVGTGMVKSPITVCNDIFVEMRKMHKHLERGDVMLRVHPEVVKQLKTAGSKWLQEMEEMCGKTILVKSDPSLHPEQFDIH